MKYLITKEELEMCQTDSVTQILPPRPLYERKSLPDMSDSLIQCIVEI